MKTAQQATLCWWSLCDLVGDGHVNGWCTNLCTYKKCYIEDCVGEVLQLFLWLTCKSKEEAALWKDSFYKMPTLEVQEELKVEVTRLWKAKGCRHPSTQAGAWIYQEPWEAPGRWKSWNSPRCPLWSWYIRSSSSSSHIYSLNIILGLSPNVSWYVPWKKNNFLTSIILITTQSSH